MATAQHIPILIGMGGYAKVFKVDNIAVKKVSRSDKGLGVETPIEAFIMLHLNSPYLAKATTIEVDSDSNMSLYQELAFADLANFVRVNTIPLEIIPRLLWQICKGVEVLHNNNIVHGDIKGANVLIFYTTDWESAYVKLCDFSLAGLVASTSEGINNKAYTVTHRPLEVWQDRKWSFPADIWALAVTLYEIYYRRLLFPAQDTDHRENLRKAYMCVHRDWNIESHHPHRVPAKKPWDKGNFIYKPYILEEKWSEHKNHTFNDLILRMLREDPTTRPTIKEVLAHDFFRGYTCTLPLNVRVPSFNNLEDLILDLRERDSNMAPELCYTLLVYKITRTPIPFLISIKMDDSLRQEEIALLQRLNYRF